MYIADGGVANPLECAPKQTRLQKTEQAALLLQESLDSGQRRISELEAHAGELEAARQTEPASAASFSPDSDPRELAVVLAGMLPQAAVAKLVKELQKLAPAGVPSTRREKAKNGTGEALAEMDAALAKRSSEASQGG
jgi:hypothetical protein